MITEDNNHDYYVTFRINYKTNFGQNLFIYGSVPELGNWKKPVAKMKWNEGHLWKSRVKFSSHTKFFEYKFVVAEGEKLIWESGHNRLFSKHKFEEEEEITIHSAWERFFVRFLIYFPIQDRNSYMQIIGGSKSIGNWYKDNGHPIRMSLGEHREIHGVKGRFWEVQVEFNANEVSNYEFEYRYSLYNTETKSALWEREPNRKIILLTDVNYLNLSTEEYEKMFPPSSHESEMLLNHNILRFDINFVTSLDFNKIGDYPIFIGPYPQNEEDIKKMNEEGVTAVLNVQSDIDFVHRQINWNNLLMAYSKYGIDIVRHPILDFNQEDLIDKLKNAGEKLKALIQRQHMVYVHCTAGMSRAAATVIIYLCFNENMTLQAAHDFVKSHRKIICPNMGAIGEVIKRYERESIGVDDEDDQLMRN